MSDKIVEQIKKHLQQVLQMPLYNTKNWLASDWIQYYTVRIPPSRRINALKTLVKSKAKTKPKAKSKRKPIDNEDDEEEEDEIKIKQPKQNTRSKGHGTRTGDRKSSTQSSTQPSTQSSTQSSSKFPIIDLTSDDDEPSHRGLKRERSRSRSRSSSPLPDRNVSVAKSKSKSLSRSRSRSPLPLLDRNVSLTKSKSKSLSRSRSRSPLSLPDRNVSLTKSKSKSRSRSRSPSPSPDRNVSLTKSKSKSLSRSRSPPVERKVQIQTQKNQLIPSSGLISFEKVHASLNEIYQTPWTDDDDQKLGLDVINMSDVDERYERNNSVDSDIWDMNNYKDYDLSEQIGKTKKSSQSYIQTHLFKDDDSLSSHQRQRLIEWALKDEILVLLEGRQTSVLQIVNNPYYAEAYTDPYAVKSQYSTIVWEILCRYFASVDPRDSVEWKVTNDIKLNYWVRLNEAKANVLLPFTMPKERVKELSTEEFVTECLILYGIDIGRPQYSFFENEKDILFDDHDQLCRLTFRGDMISLENYFEHENPVIFYKRPHSSWKRTWMPMISGHITHKIGTKSTTKTGLDTESKKKEESPASELDSVYYLQSDFYKRFGSTSQSRQAFLRSVAYPQDHPHRSIALRNHMTLIVRTRYQTCFLVLSNPFLEEMSLVDRAPFVAWDLVCHLVYRKEYPDLNHKRIHLESYRQKMNRALELDHQHRRAGHTIVPQVVPKTRLDLLSIEEGICELLLIGGLVSRHSFTSSSSPFLSEPSFLALPFRGEVADAPSTSIQLVYETRKEDWLLKYFQND